MTSIIIVYMYISPVTFVNSYTGLKIMAGHRTMSGQDKYLSRQNLGLAVILTGHRRPAAKFCP